jgi:hypothetical protein
MVTAFELQDLIWQTDARFSIGEYFTMNTSDIEKLLEYYSDHKMAIVHPESASPAIENRKYISDFLFRNNISSRVFIIFPVIRSVRLFR